MIPQNLKERAVFCGWKREDGRKIPYNVRTGARARSTDITDFVPYEEAEKVQRFYDGLGIGVFNGICAIDIDHCYDPLIGATPEVEDIIAAMDTYTELSPSGTGVRILFFASPEYDKEQFYINNQKAGIEVYVAGATNKFVTVTGDTVCGSELQERTEALKGVLDKYMRRPAKPPEEAREACAPMLSDEQVLAKAMTNPKFADLWSGGLGDSPSASEADLATCAILAFWTRRNADQMDRLFRSSARMRPKWDEFRGARTYGVLTVEKAIMLCATIYDPATYIEKQHIAAGMDFRNELVRLAEMKPEDNPRYSWSDTGACRLFADWQEGHVRYVDERKKWYIWNGHIWAADNGVDAKMHELLKNFATLLNQYADLIKDEDKREAYQKHAKRWLTRAFRETIIKDTRGIDPADMDDFDANLDLLNVQNGAIDLRTGEFHEHREADMCTLVAGVSYDPTARCERWEQFINEVMVGDKERAGFLQRALGYAMSGRTNEECMFMLYGATTRNGKGTLTSTITKMLGEYAKTASPETLSARKSGGSGPSEDVARLRGARFVAMSEPDKNMRLNTALLKTMTGGDTLTARYLNENSLEFVPRFKLFINTNYLPNTGNDTSVFASDRMHTIPFERHFSREEQDRTLKETLTSPENLSGILNWCIEGYRMYLKDGLNPPAAVVAATREYANASDQIGMFMEENLEKGIEKAIELADAYQQYKAWCDLNGFRPENATGFKTSVERTTTIGRKRLGKSDTMVSVIMGYAAKAGTAAGFQALNSRKRDEG